MGSSPSFGAAQGAATLSQGNFNLQIICLHGGLWRRRGGGVCGTSEFPLSGWWLLAAAQAPLKSRALCWALSRFAGWCPNPASLLPLGPLSNLPRALQPWLCPFPWGGHYPWIYSPLPVRAIPLLRWAPICGVPCPCWKLHPAAASPAVAAGRIGRSSKGLMKTDWQRLGMLVLRRLSATAAQRAALICLPTAKVPKEALPAAPC